MKMSHNKTLSIKFPDDDENEPHPFCEHGPTLLFEYANKQVDAIVESDCETRAYYACAAHRDKRSCSFHVYKQQVTAALLQKRYDCCVDEQSELRSKLLGNDFYYCYECAKPFLQQAQAVHTAHAIAKLNKEDLTYPTRFLDALQNDKSHAQYLFDENALKFFLQAFKDLGIDKVLCIGAPHLHAYLQNNKEARIKSYLLDYDKRLLYFYDDACFGWYNMCNNHFFVEAQKRAFEQFLKNDKKHQKLLIFTDPPFACRTEIIAHTLQQLQARYNRLNQLPQQPLPIFWIYPYYTEHYVRAQMPQLQMCDYKVNYINHGCYTNTGDKARKYGSPVRLYTNVPLTRLQLPISEQYKYCAKCSFYTALENRHCDKCGYCPSKNGQNYKHCAMCGKCVKPNYAHCASCRRCCIVEAHVCEQYQLHQQCWICRQQGHIERNCSEFLQKLQNKHLLVRELKQQKTILCLLCGIKGHNEVSCKQRSNFLQEHTFMGNTLVSFK